MLGFLYYSVENTMSRAELVNLFLTQEIQVVCSLELLQVKVLQTFVCRFLLHIHFNSLREMPRNYLSGSKVHIQCYKKLLNYFLP